MKTPIQRLIEIHDTLPAHHFHAYFDEMKEVFLHIEKDIIENAFWGGKDGHSSNGIDYYNKIHNNENK